MNVMAILQCDECHGAAAPLARTASRVWLGCPRCHRTWNVDATACGAMLEDPTGIPDQAGPPYMSPLRGCLVAVLAVALALALRILLRPMLGTASPFLLFTPPVAIAALYGGVAPGVLATALSTGLGSQFFLSASESTVERWDRVILFAVVGGVITGSSTLLRQSRQQLAESLWREQRARAAAEAADRTKDDFLAVVSHELQTPMSVVLGWIAAIRQRPLTGAALDHALDAVERNARMLSRLVDDVLDRSRIATGTLRLAPEVISLERVVRAAVDQMRGRIDSAGLQLELATPADEPVIVGDPIRLQQVVTNLLSNAVKFTPRGGRIAVTLAATASDARLTIADTGRGIDANMLPHLFDAFWQARETLAQSARGLGLGLAIARYLVERHDGAIEAASAGPGCGSAFTITLPLAKTASTGNAPGVTYRPSSRVAAGAAR